MGMTLAIFSVLGNILLWEKALNISTSKWAICGAIFLLLFFSFFCYLDGYFIMTSRAVFCAFNGAQYFLNHGREEGHPIIYWPLPKCLLLTFMGVRSRFTLISVKWILNCPAISWSVTTLFIVWVCSHVVILRFKMVWSTFQVVCELLGFWSNLFFKYFSFPFPRVVVNWFLTERKAAP